MLYCEMPSGIVAPVHDDLELAPGALGGLRLQPCSRSSAWLATVPSVEMAPLATDGSVASASIRICGRSPPLDAAREIGRDGDDEGDVAAAPSAPRPPRRSAATWSKR